MKRSQTEPLVRQLVQSALRLPTTLSSPASPSVSWKVLLCRLIPCARKRGALTSYLTRGSVCDTFTIPAHSSWHCVCRGLAACHLASRQGPSSTGNTLVLADTHMSALRLTPRASSCPAAQPTTQVLPTVEFVQSSASNFSVWAMVLSEHRNKVVVTPLGNCKPVSALV